MLSHTRNRQSCWIKVIEAFEFEAATAPMAKAKPNCLRQTVCSRRKMACQARQIAHKECKLDKQNHVFHQHLYYNSPYFCLSLCLSVALIWGLYRTSSEPIALRNVLKRSTRHTLHIIQFWHFSSAVIITKNAKNCVC